MPFLEVFCKGCVVSPSIYEWPTVSLTHSLFSHLFSVFPHLPFPALLSSQFLSYAEKTIALQDLRVHLLAVAILLILQIYTFCCRSDQVGKYPFRLRPGTGLWRPFLPPTFLTGQMPSCPLLTHPCPPPTHFFFFLIFIWYCQMFCPS